MERTILKLIMLMDAINYNGEIKNKFRDSIADRMYELNNGSLQNSLLIGYEKEIILTKKRFL
jgi:hypothetical protein